MRVTRRTTGRQGHASAAAVVVPGAAWDLVAIPLVGGPARAEIRERGRERAIDGVVVDGPDRARLAG